MKKQITLLIAFMLVGSGCDNTNYNQQRENRTTEWKEMIKAEIPVGSEVKKVTEWFSNKGYKAQADLLQQNKDLTVFLDSFPAEDWFCDKWFITVKINILENKVDNYEFGAAGACL